MKPLDRDAPILVTGHRGMVGSAVVRRLRATRFAQIPTATRRELDLRDQTAVSRWFNEFRSRLVVHVIERRHFFTSSGQKRCGIAS